MKFSQFRLLMILLTLAFTFGGCNSDDDNPNTQNANIVGTWQMYGNTRYGLEFTNYGIVKWKNTPYMDSNLNYSLSGNILTVSEKTGLAIFSNNGNTLNVSGFSNPSDFGAGGTGPYINGIYIRQ